MTGNNNVKRTADETSDDPQAKRKRMKNTRCEKEKKGKMLCDMQK